MTSGRRIILTRQRERNTAWAARLVAAEYDVVELPLIRYEALTMGGKPDLGSYDWILFTSPQGVRAFGQAGLETGDTRIATLGSGTAAALKEFGWKDELGLQCADGAEFAQAFLAKVSGPGRVLLPGPNRRLEEPRVSLEAGGFVVGELPLYETAPIRPGDLPKADFAPGDIVFFCSPSTVLAFVNAWKERPRCVTIGKTTARAAKASGFETAVAATPDLSAMVLAAGLDPLPEPASPEMES
jgi:uroporphyrinogen III methyltransferase/synthase